MANSPSFGRIPDGGPLRELSNGLIVIRRMKHEWRDDLEDMAFDKLKMRTGKKWGSKFFGKWSLDRHVEWVSAQIATLGWQRQNQPLAAHDVRMDEPIGLAGGVKVHTIRIVCDGRYVHAYPLED